MPAPTSGGTEPAPITGSFFEARAVRRVRSSGLAVSGGCPGLGAGPSRRTPAGSASASGCAGLAAPISERIPRGFPPEPRSLPERSFPSRRRPGSPRLSLSRSGCASSTPPSRPSRFRSPLPGWRVHAPSLPSGDGTPPPPTSRLPIPRERSRAASPRRAALPTPPWRSRRRGHRGPRRKPRRARDGTRREIQALPPGAAAVFSRSLFRSGHSILPYLPDPEIGPRAEPQRVSEGPRQVRMRKMRRDLQRRAASAFDGRLTARRTSPGRGSSPPVPAPSAFPFWLWPWSWRLPPPGPRSSPAPSRWRRLPGNRSGTPAAS